MALPNTYLSVRHFSKISLMGRSSNGSRRIFGKLAVYNHTCCFRYFFRRGLVIQGFLKKFDDCKYTKFSLKDYIGEDVLAKAEALGFQQLLRKLGFKNSLENDIQIFVVEKGPSVVCPQQFATYSIPGMESYIFIRDEPNKIKGVGKFFIYHEVGHTLVMSAALKLRLLNGNKSLSFFYFGVYGIFFGRHNLF